MTKSSSFLHTHTHTQTNGRVYGKRSATNFMLGLINL